VFYTTWCMYGVYVRCFKHAENNLHVRLRGGATQGRARSNDLAGRSTALAPPCLLLCFGNSVIRKFKKMLPYLTSLFVSFWQWNNQRRWRPVFWGRRLKRSSTFLRKKYTADKILATPLTPGDLAWWFCDLQMAWLLYCASGVQATANIYVIPDGVHARLIDSSCL